MAGGAGDNKEAQVDPRWLQTAKALAEPHQSIHVRPQASAAEVSKLTKTLMPADGSAPLSKPVQETQHAQGVMGQDFFAFSRVLGHGGMGCVYNARQESMAREVAVKTLRDNAQRDPTTEVSFLREALTTGALSHPNIVPVHFFGRDAAQRPFMVMKRVQGRPWNELLASKGNDEFDIRFHLEIFLKVCDAVAFAHANKIVHRDLKPGNVMVGDYGEVTLMDWGLAFDFSPEGDRGLAIPKSEASAIAGTPAYMAPEMVRCDLTQLGPKTDIYLLGGTLYEILTAQPPHTGNDILEVLKHAVSGRIDKLQPRSGLAREARALDRIIGMAMAPNPAERYADVSALQSDIRAFLAGQGDRRESEALAQSAREELNALKAETEDRLVTSPFYPRCSEIVAKAQQAIALWGFNPRAVRVRQEATALFAELALREKDWGLAESLLRDLKLSGSGGHALAQPIDNRLRAGRQGARVREYLVQRVARMAAIAVVVMTALSIYLYWQMRSYEEKLLRFELAPPLADDEPSAPPDPRPRNPANPANPSTPEPNTARDFAPLAMPPWRLPQDPGPRSLRTFLISSDAHMLLQDDAGGLWHWNSSLAPETVRLLSKPSTSRLSGLAWGEGRVPVVAFESGELFSGELPKNSAAEVAWQALPQASGAVRVLAARQDVGRLLLSTATHDSLQIGLQGKDPLLQNVAGPALALQYLPSGTVLCANESSIRAWTPANMEISIPLEQAYDLGRIAVAAPVLVLRSAVRRNEIHLVYLDLKVPKANRTPPISELGGGEIAAVALSSDGHLIAVGSSQGDLVLLGGSPLRILSKARAHAGAVRAIEFSYDAALLYTADAAGLICVWKIATMRP